MKRPTVWIILILILGLTGCDQNQKDKPLAGIEYVNSIKKIDIHTHIHDDAPYFRDVLDSLNMKVTTVCFEGSDKGKTAKQIKTSICITKDNPRYYAWITTFDLTDWDKSDWAEKVIKQLKKDFDNGAIGVKVWKDIGMGIKNHDGKYIQIDDPMFDPVFQFIAAEGKTLIAHIGEPIDAWTPGNVEGKPQHYWVRHPEVHFWDKPDKPSYSDLMAARDHILDKYPELRIVGAHLGSMSHNVNEMIKRLDRYPNFAVEIGGRTRYLMWQVRGKVRHFFINYQDRIMYGTDRGAWLFDAEGEAISDDQKNNVKQSYYDRYNLFLQYYATDDEIPWANNARDGKPVPEPEYNIQGLALPNEVLEKLYYRNAVKWFSGVDKEFN